MSPQLFTYCSSTKGSPELSVTVPTRFPYQTDKIHRQSHHAGMVIKNLDYSFLAFTKTLVFLGFLIGLFFFYYLSVHYDRL